MFSALTEYLQSLDSPEANCVNCNESATNEYLAQNNFLANIAYLSIQIYHITWRYIRGETQFKIKFIDNF